MNLAIDKTDLELKRDVLAEMAFEPSIQITDIGVLVKDGVVTLNGRAENHGEQMNAVRAALRVEGVVGVADDIAVELPEFGSRTDGDITAAAANRLDWSTLVPKGQVQISVREGRITLEGEVPWGYQREAAGNVLHHMVGVKAISNLITVHPSEPGADLEAEIQAALRRSALVDARDIHVEATGSAVVLTGKVHNHTELEEVVRVAWAPQGVHTVDNRLKVDWFWGMAD